MVVDALSGQPIDAATVTLAEPGLTPEARKAAPPITAGGRGGRGAGLRVVTSGNGVFEFIGLESGRLRVAASKIGYVGGYVGQLWHNGPDTPLGIGTGERRSSILIPLWKTAVVSGHVSDESNASVAGVPVVLVKRLASRFAPVLQFGPRTETDLNGDYRFSNVPPGEWMLALPGTTPETSGPPHPLVFYPDALSPREATVIRVNPGEEINALDFRLAPSRQTLVDVSGRITNPPRFPGPIELYRVEDSTGVEASFPSFSARVERDGRFSFHGVALGRYMSQSIGLDSVEPGRPNFVWTKTLVTVDKPMSNLEVIFQDGFSIAGRVVSADSKPTSTGDIVGSVLVVAVYEGFLPLALPSLGPSVDENGRFETMRLPPGRYLLSMVDTRRQWRTLSVQASGAETLGAGGVVIIDRPVRDVEVKITRGATQSIAGTVRDASGKVRSDVTLYLFPAIKEHRRFGITVEVRTSATGQFRFDEIMPGDYFVAAHIGAGPENWQSEDALQQLSRRAERLSLKRGDQQTLNLRVP